MCNLGYFSARGRFSPGGSSSGSVVRSAVVVSVVSAVVCVSVSVVAVSPGVLVFVVAGRVTPGDPTRAGEGGREQESAPLERSCPIGSGLWCAFVHGPVMSGDACPKPGGTSPSGVMGMLVHQFTTTWSSGYSLWTDVP